MADVNISKYRASVVRDGSKPASPGFVVSEGQDPVNPPGTNNFVPYTGATANVDLGEYGLESGFVTLDTTPTNTPTDQGTIYWDDTRSTAALIMNGTLQHIGQDSFFYVKNSSGSTIPKGTCVGFAGTDGGSGHLLVTPFLANGSVPSTYFMGVTCESIANGAFGQVMNFGELEGINTSGFTAGALLYASTTVAGGFQTTVPVAPNNIVLVAAAVNSKNNGAIVVRPTYGSNINSDEGVKITSPTTGDLLQLQAGGLWENKTKAQILGGTSSQFVKGDGSLDSNTYLTTASAASTYLPLTGGTLTGALNGTTANFSGTTFVGGGISSNVVSQSLTFDSKNILYGNLTIGQVPAQATLGVAASGIVSEFPASTALTIKNTGNLLVGTTTDNGATLQVSGAATFSSSVTAGSFIRIGGTSSQYLMADGSVSTLTNPVTGTGTTNYLPKFTGTSTIGNSKISESGNIINIDTTNGGISIGTSGTNDISWGTAGGIKLSRTNVGPEYALSQRWTGSLAFVDIASSSQWNGGVTILPNSGGSVGIGTATPNARLQVGDLANTSGVKNDILITGDTVNTNGFYSRLIFGNSSQSGGSTASIRGERSNGSNFATSLTFFTNGTASAGDGSERMRLDASGNLGLGVTPSAWNSSFRAIQVGVGASFWASNISTLPYAYMSSNQLYDASNTSKYIINGFASWYIQEEGTHKWLNAPSGTAGNAISFTQAMTLNASGNLGIGTANPAVKLDVIGEIRSTSTSGYGALVSVSALNLTILADTHTNGNLTFWTAGSEKSRVTSTGNLLVGTTSDNGARLQVSGNARITGSTNEQLVLDFTTASGGFTWQSFRLNGTNRYRIFGNTDNSFTLWSDILSSNVLSIASTGVATFTNNVNIIQSNGSGFVNVGSSSGRGQYQNITFGGSNGGVDYGWQVGRSPQTGGVISDGFYIYDIRTNLTAFTMALGGAATFSSSVTSQVNNISADGAGVVLQGYVDNNLRIAVRGSGYNSGARGGLLASTGDFSGTVNITTSSTTGFLRVGGGNGAGESRIFIEANGNNSYIDSYGDNAYKPLQIQANHLILNSASGGNVLVGTSTNGGYRLDVAGQIRSFSASPLVVSMTSNPSVSAIVGARWTSGVGMNMSYFPDFAQGFIDNTYPVTAGEVYGDIYFRQNVSGTMTSRMMIQARSGNVGIGNVSPGQRLEVTGFVKANGFSINDNTTTSGFIGYEKNWIGSGTSARLAIAAESDAINFYTSGSSVERVRFGNSSIHTNPNNTAFSMYLHLNRQSTQDGGILLSTDNSLDWQIVNANRDLWFYSYGLGTTAFRVMRNTGNFLIGTTDDNGNRLRVNGNVWVDGEVAVNAITCTSGNTNTFINPIGTTGIIYSGQGTTAVHQFLVNSGERFAVLNTGIRTIAPTGGTAVPWRLGTARGGTVTSNATVRVEIDGALVDLVARYV